MSAEPNAKLDQNKYYEGIIVALMLRRFSVMRDSYWISISPRIVSG